MPARNSFIAPELESFTSLASSIVTAPLSGFTTGITRAATYNGNLARPNLLPDLRDLVECYLKGLITEATFNEYAEFQGYGEYKGIWSSVFLSKHPSPTLDTLARMLYRGTFSGSQADQLTQFYSWAKVAGWWNRDYTNLVLNAPWPWTAEEARKLHALRRIPRDKFTALLRAIGLRRDEDIDYFSNLIQPPPPEQIIELWNRGEINSLIADQWLIQNGYTNEQVRTKIESLRFKIPSMSDIVRFAVKEVWSPEIVQTYGYDLEFPAEFEYWANKAGFGGSPDTDSSSSVNGGPRTWAHAFWREHWQNISPSQAYSMLHRLRPTGGPGNGPRVPSAGTFTQRDVENVLKINDYPEFFRAKLAALSYNVLRLVDIRRIMFRAYRNEHFKNTVIGANLSIIDWAREQYLDRGQTPEDANTLANLSYEEAREAARARRERKTAFLRNRKFKVSQQEYAIGIIEREAAIANFEEAGLDNEDAIALANTMDREFSVNCAKGNLSMIRTLFRKGKAKEDVAKRMLIAAGFTNTGAEKWLACWKSTKTPTNAEDETLEVIEKLRAGVISREDAIETLTNLGWTNPEELIENEEVIQLLGTM